MTSKRLPIVLAVLALLGWVRNSSAADTDLVASSERTVAQYKATDPGLGRLFEKSAGFAVFPNITKGGFVVGGAAGDGVVFSHGQAIGKVNLAQASIGAQIGGQTYSELIFFENENVLSRFKTSDLTFSAQVSAVALQSGVSQNAKYTDGVIVITAAKGGLMAEASVGGQKFRYEPFAKPIPTG